MNKIYFKRLYDQWKFKVIAIDNVNNIIPIILPDLQFDDINLITYIIKDVNNATYSGSCLIDDPNKRLIGLKLPLKVMSNSGAYELTLTVKYNDNTTVKCYSQTFAIESTIEVDDNILKQESNFPILEQLIEQIKSNPNTPQDLSEYLKKSELKDELDKLGITTTTQSADNNTTASINQEQLDDIMDEIQTNRTQIDDNIIDLENSINSLEGDILALNDIINQGITQLQVNSNKVQITTDKIQHIAVSTATTLLLPSGYEGEFKIYITLNSDTTIIFTDESVNYKKSFALTKGVYGFTFANIGKWIYNGQTYVS